MPAGWGRWVWGRPGRKGWARARACMPVGRASQQLQAQQSPKQPALAQPQAHLAHRPQQRVKRQAEWPAVAAKAMPLLARDGLWPA